jgi:hypothetical protein
MASPILVDERSFVVVLLQAKYVAPTYFSRSKLTSTSVWNFREIPDRCTSQFVRGLRQINRTDSS